MGAFVCYKLPHASGYVRMEVSGDPEVLTDWSELRGRGFVVAPFEPSADCPIVVFRTTQHSTPTTHHHPSTSQPLNFSTISTSQPLNFSTISTSQPLNLSTSQPFPTHHPTPTPRGGFPDVSERERYAADFARFHAELCGGGMEKLVLSRSSVVECVDDVDVMELFERACVLYEGQFVALFSSAQTGTWLMATPEFLLEGSGRDWRTMALAGTRRRGEPREAWSEKECREQGLVTAYLTERIGRLTKDFWVEGPHSVEAGHLLHLRTDIGFRLPAAVGVGRLVSLLHPTPAVCGLPADEAKRFILANESHARGYYSGFCGLLDERETRLWVSLRCMMISGRQCRLYAGGGLLAESDEQTEWEETVAKLETMLRVL
ncbi:MAG: chorismate-binding protein [Prevotella sp.]|nr:chorismate-binding protein [Prevotella sp.]